MSGYSVTTLHKGIAKAIGEGPVWLKDSKEWAFIDILESRFIKVDYATNESQEIRIPGNEFLSLSQPTTTPDLYVGLAGHDVIAFRWNQPEDYNILATADQGIDSRFNDGNADRSGRLWAGTMAIEHGKPGEVPTGLGTLYSMDIEKELGTCHPIKQAYPDKFNISNGIDWTTDNKTMLFTDSPTMDIYSFNYDETNGNIKNKQVAITLDQLNVGLPDGCTMDADNKLWVACFFGACICRFDVETGKLIQKIQLDTQGITSCIFGGPHLNQLFVTSANLGYENGGSIYRIDGLDGVRGLPTNLLNTPKV